jgi:hypothetical protein
MSDKPERKDFVADLEVKGLKNKQPGSKMPKKIDIKELFSIKTEQTYKFGGKKQ